jgi:hypothetical protein
VNEQKGWVVGATEILAYPQYEDWPECWGHDLLKKAAAGDISLANRPFHWYAAKINIHMACQIKHVLLGDPASDEDED